MNDKNKSEIKLGEQVKGAIDSTLDKKDSKAFYEITNAIKKIEENPILLNKMEPIINYYDENLLQRLESYKGKIIDRLRTCSSLVGPSKFENFGLGIEGTLIRFYDASILYNSKKISVESFIEDLKQGDLKRGLYLNFAIFRNDAYEIELSDKPLSKEFLIKSAAISMENI